MSAIKRNPIPKLKRLQLGRDVIDLELYLKADYSNINDAADELPAVIEWVNAQNQGYVERLHNLKHEVEEAEAAAFFRLHESPDEGFATLHPGIKVTQVAIDHAIALDPEVRSKKLAYASARGWVERLRQLQSSLTSKLDLTRSSEATRRKVFDDTDALPD